MNYRWNGKSTPLRGSYISWSIPSQDPKPRNHEIPGKSARKLRYNCVTPDKCTRNANVLKSRNQPRKICAKGIFIARASLHRARHPILMDGFSGWRRFYGYMKAAKIRGASINFTVLRGRGSELKSFKRAKPWILSSKNCRWSPECLMGGLRHSRCNLPFFSE